MTFGKSVLFFSSSCEIRDLIYGFLMLFAIKELILWFKGCVWYIFASLFFKSKLQHLPNWERRFLFHFKSSFRSQENQILGFYILKFHEVINT